MLQKQLSRLQELVKTQVLGEVFQYSKSKFLLGFIYWGHEREEYQFYLFHFNFDPLGGSSLLLTLAAHLRPPCSMQGWDEFRRWRVACMPRGVYGLDFLESWLKIPLVP